MTPNGWEVLESRVTKLEKQNRWLKASCVFSGLAVVCVLGLGASRVASTVEAQRFVLKTAKGEVRGELTLPDGNFPILRLGSPNGEKVMELSPVGVSVFDGRYPWGVPAGPGNLPAAHLGIYGLYFTDLKGRVVMELGGASVEGLQSAPIPQITLFDKNGHPSWRVP